MGAEEEREVTRVVGPIAVIGSILGAIVLSIWGVVAWGFDYGQCLKSHQEPRHSDAWVEMRHTYCGKDCEIIVPVYHPSEDWIVTVCDLYEYPDGCGPSAGYKRKATCR